MDTTQAAVKARSPEASKLDASPPMERPSRLVVVVPDVAEAGLLAARIRQIAEVRRQEVLLLGVASGLHPDSEVRRRLTLVAAFLQDAGTRTQIQIEVEEDLLSSIQAVLGADDMLACCVFEGTEGGAAAWPDRLTSWFRRPVYALLESATPTAPQAGTPASLAPWLVSIAIILAFFWLQVRISQSGTGAITTDLLMGSIVVEIGLISLSNALLG